MKYKKLAYILFVFLFMLLNLSLVIATSHSKETIDNYFRLHVVANSDSIDDQILKLNVSKCVENYIQEITQGINNKEDYVEIITNNIHNILSMAKHTILELNSNYDITAYIGKIKYDEKTKEGITMPEGTYDSLKIVIGNGNGENWWSLLFPHSIEGYDAQEIMSNEDVKYASGIIDFIYDFVNTLKKN